MLTAWFVLAVLAVAAVLFCLERVPVDAVALGVLVVLLLAGVITPDQALAGFASEAVVVIGGLFILTAGLKRSGVLEWLGQRLQGIGARRPRLAVALLLGAVASASAFMNNTTTTAVFLPVALSFSRSLGLPPGRLLMPLAFASILGGSVTLIGTSTNVLTSGLLMQQGLPGLGLFELAPVALPIAGLGLLYLMVAPRWLLRDVPAEERTDDYGLRNYLTELVVREGSPLVGLSLRESNFGRRWGVQVVGRVLADGNLAPPSTARRLAAGDHLLAHGRLDALERLTAEADVVIHRGPGSEEVERETRGLATQLIEVLVLPWSDVVGRSLEEVGFRQRFSASAIAVNRHGQRLLGKVGRISLAAGDVLLLYGEAAAERFLTQRGMLVLGRRLRGAGLSALLAPAIFALVIALNVTGVVGLAGSVLLGCLLLIVARCLTPQEAYAAVEWRVLVLVAGMMAAASALESSGAVEMIAAGAMRHAGGLGPLGILAAFYVLTLILTQPMSNQTAALVVLPVAFGVAAQAGIEPRAVAVTISLAASCSFLTPLEPSCLLVYGPGGYRFLDFPKLGLALTLLAFVLTLLLVPRVWPL